MREDKSPWGDPCPVHKVLYSGSQCPLCKDEELTHLRARVAELEGALRRSMVAIDDWLNIHAPEYCDEKRIMEAKMRVSRLGTIGYIAEVQARNRAVLNAPANAGGTPMAAHAHSHVLAAEPPSSRRGEPAPRPAQSPAGAVTACPRCGEEDERSVGMNRCGLCECEFSVLGRDR